MLKTEKQIQAYVKSKDFDKRCNQVERMSFFYIYGLMPEDASILFILPVIDNIKKLLAERA